MDIGTLASVAGLAFTVTTATNSHAFKLQQIEGTKICDNQTIRVLYREEKVYIRTTDRVYTFASVPTNKGVTNVRRFETKDRTLSFLQLPEKAMILNNATMRPVSNDCLNV